GAECPAALLAHCGRCDAARHHLHREWNRPRSRLSRRSRDSGVKHSASRQLKSAVMICLTYAAALLATLPLLLILWHLGREGLRAISLSFFTKMPTPVGEPGGGMANAIVGTLILIAIASLIGLPIGIGAGLLLA